MFVGLSVKREDKEDFQNDEVESESQRTFRRAFAQARHQKGQREYRVEEGTRRDSRQILPGEIEATYSNQPVPGRVWILQRRNFQAARQGFVESAVNGSQENEEAVSVPLQEHHTIHGCTGPTSIRMRKQKIFIKLYPYINN